jgi:pimeloyl-ACP methyl ester carboxylesterase
MTGEAGVQYHAGEDRARQESETRGESLGELRARVTGTGPLLVLVPGMDGTGQLFYRQTPRLARSFRTVTYALRDEATSIDVLVDDLRRLVERAGGRDARAMVLGESFGGALAMRFALEHPRHVSGLVVLNSFPYFAPQMRLALARLALGALPWGTMAIVRRVTASRMHSRFTSRADIGRFLAISRAISRTGYLNRLGMLREYDVRDRLGRLETPALFLAAAEDHLVPAVSQARYMASLAPRARVRVLEGHGHICLIAPNLDLERMLVEWRDEEGIAF